MIKLTKQLSILLNNNELFDIFAAKEEYSGRKDQQGRFLYEYSNNKAVLSPIVSNYLRSSGLPALNWPENHKFAACLTHDIDTIYPTWKYALLTAGKFVSKLRLKSSLQRIAGKNKKNARQNPYWNFEEILKLENRYGGKSSFFFKTSLNDPVGWSYKIEDLEHELHVIVDLGGEIGLHGGYFSYNNAEELKKEKQLLDSLLGKKTIGIRMHYLRFDVPITWRLLSNLGFKYDTSFGYPDMPGFRNGMCDPFLPYDLLARKEIDIVEIPLTIMDSCLFTMAIDEAWIIVKNLIETIERNGGVMTILWHNNNLDEIYLGNWVKIYEKILQLLKKKNAWITTGEQIFEFWKRTYGI